MCTDLDICDTSNFRDTRCSIHNRRVYDIYLGFHKFLCICLIDPINTTYQGTRGHSFNRRNSDMNYVDNNLNLLSGMDIFLDKILSTQTFLMRKMDTQLGIEFHTFSSPLPDISAMPGMFYSTCTRIVSYTNYF